MEANIEIEKRLERIEALLLNQKTILTLEEVAIYANLSQSYLYKLTSRGDIPFYKPNGKQLYFKREEIDQWLLRNRVSTNDEIQDEAITTSTLRKRKSA